VFQSESPLHDGAVIIQENRVAAAACFLPLTVNAQSTNLGTRHRAAIGLTEESDAVALIVSEETGIVSLVRDGEIESDFDSKQLAKHLDAAMHPRRSRRRSFSKKAE
jgi:diadenylate cyclase